MTYSIYKSDGSKLTDVLDGTIDTTTDLILIGKNFSGFGESLNENLVYLLENFSNTTPPSRPITGQIWYNSNESKLQVYTGNTNGWKSAATPTVSQTQPLNLVTGDFWINNADQQLYFYDGSVLTLAGQIWTKSQGITGFKAKTLFDQYGNAKPVLQLYVKDSLLGIFSSESFIPDPTHPLEGFSSISKGYTSNSTIATTFDIKAVDSQKLNGLSGNSYLKSDNSNNNSRSTMSVPLTIQTQEGMTIGSASNIVFYASGLTLRIENQEASGNISLRTTNSTGNTVDNVFINSTTGFVGILTNNPQRQLDVNGAARIQGTFEVNGKILTVPIELTLIDNDILTDVHGKTILILTDVASPQYYLPGQVALVHFQHIDFAGHNITRYLQRYIISSTINPDSTITEFWTFDSNLTSSV